MRSRPRPRRQGSELTRTSATGSTTSRTFPRQSTFLIVLITILVAATGCFLDRAEVRFTFDNRTDSLICYYLGPGAAAAGQCDQEIKPLAKTAWRPGCGYGAHPEKLPLAVILTVAEGGRRIYDRTAECRVWQDSDRTFTIEQRGDEFLVTDSLPHDTSSP